MAELFSEDWMSGYKDAWNAEPELTETLGKIGFSSTIAYGFDGEDAPAGVVVVENGKIISAGPYTDQELNWDLRANKESWEKWLEKGIGMMGLGAAYTTGKIKFKVGDYKAMAKDPRMAGPFVKSFSIMGGV